MQNLTTSDWLTIIAITVAVIGILIGLVIGIIQIKKKNNPINITQKQGSFSKGTQSININGDN